MITLDYKTIAFGLFCGLFLVIAPYAPRAVTFAPVVLILLSLIFYKNTFNVFKIHYPSLIIGGLTLTLCYASTFWSHFPEESAARMEKLWIVIPTSMICLTLLHSMRFRKESARLITGFTVIALSLGILLTLSELRLGPHIYTLIHSLPADGSFNFSIFNRGLIILLICMFPILSYYEAGKRYSLTVGLLLLMIATVIAGESQTAQLGLLLAVLVWMFSDYKTLRPIIVGLIGLILIVLWAGFPFLAPLIFENRPDVNALPQWVLNAYPMERMEIWALLGQKIQAAPLLGYGLEATREMTLADSTQYLGGTKVLHPHNLIVQVWLQFGALGATLGLGASLWSLHAIRYKPSRLAQFTAFYVAALFSYGMWQGWFVALFIFSVALCLILHETQMHDPNAKK